MKQPKESKYQSIYDHLRPEIGRTFYVDYQPFREMSKPLVKQAIRNWAKKYKVKCGVKITSPTMTGQQLLVSVKRRESEASHAMQF